MLDTTTIKHLIREVMEELTIPDLVKPETIAEKSEFNVQTIRNYCKTKQLKAYKFEKDWRIAPKDWNEFINRKKK